MSVSYERKSKRNDESLKTVIIGKWADINFKALNFKAINIKIVVCILPYKIKIFLFDLFNSGENEA
jgi:hypothetical protein